jgi:hypothetical protein
MRRFLATAVVLTVLAHVQVVTATTGPEERITYYLQRYSQVDGHSDATVEVLGFVDKLESKRGGFRRDIDFLEYLFVKTHHRFLKQFENYPSFGKTLSDGTYNCLTGTALYALLLDHFGFPYQIIETNYHIFLLTEAGGQHILFETTDPTGGFVSDDDLIKERIASYREHNGNTKSSRHVYQYNFDLYNSVNLDQLQGLMHYNLAIAAYNQKELVASVAELKKAFETYQSPRTREMSQLLLLAVMDSTLEADVKERCLYDLYNICKKQFDLTASVN